MDNMERQVERLRKALERSKVNREKIEPTFSAFERRLSGLVEANRPHEEPLRTHKLVDRALKSTQQILRQFTVLDQVEQVLNNVPSSRIEDAFDEIDKLELCRAFFTSQMAYSDPSFTSTVDPVLRKISELVHIGTHKAEQQFSNYLQVLARDLMDDVGIDQEILVPLQALVSKFVHWGRKMRCLELYRLSRVISVNQKLHDLGLKTMGTTIIDFMIPEWISKMEISVKSVYARERILCNEVLSGIEEPLLDDCFTGITSESLENLLSMLRDVILKKDVTSPQTLFLLMDMFKVMHDLLPEMEAMFASKAALLLPMRILTNEVAEKAVEIYLQTSEEVAKNKWSRRWNEGVHPMSRCVITYVTNIFKVEVARELFEVGCISVQRNAVKEHTDQYMKASWKKVVDTISSQDSGSNNPIITASKRVVKDRLKTFNKKFKKQCGKQRKWTVSDPELRVTLQRSVADFVVRAYKTFLEQFGPIIETSKSQCGMKYTLEDVEKKILKNLFAKGET